MQRGTQVKRPSFVKLRPTHSVGMSSSITHIAHLGQPFDSNSASLRSGQAGWRRRRLALSLPKGVGDGAPSCPRPHSDRKSSAPFALFSKDSTKALKITLNAFVLFSGCGIMGNVNAHPDSQVKGMKISPIEANEKNLLYQVSRHLSQDLDINRVLADVLQLTLNCVGADIGSILIFDDRGLVAHKILARQKIPAEKANLVIAEVLEQGLAGWVARHRQGAIVTDVLNDPKWVNFADDDFVGGSAIGVPLARRDRLVGVLTLRHAQPDHFGPEHLALLSSIAEQSAIAIENARLFYTVQTEQAKLEAIIDGANDAIVVTDPQGIILRMNALARKAFDVPEQFLNERCHLTEAFDDRDLLALWHECKAGGPPCVRELKLDNGTTLEASITETPGVGFVIMMHDVTSLKELNDLRNDFVSTISHDLRSPLQLIYTYTSLLREDQAITEHQLEFLEGINRSVKKMSDLLDDLFDLLRIGAGVEMQAECYDISRLIERVVARFEQMAAEKGLNIDVQIDALLPPVHVNPNRIDQVLSNLLDNAIKYTPQGRITVQATANDTHLNVQVIDTGIGLKPEEQRQLFARFYRARNEFTKSIDGSGLGLAIAKSIIEQYGGRMWVASKWQQGSTIGFTLPLCDKDQE